MTVDSVPLIPPLNQCEDPSRFKQSTISCLPTRRTSQDTCWTRDRSADDTVDMEPDYILQHYKCPGTYTKILFVDQFSTIVPETLSCKLFWLNASPAICQCLTGWEKSLLENGQSALELPRDVSSPCCSRLCILMTAAPLTQLLNSEACWTQP